MTKTPDPRDGPNVMFRMGQTPCMAIMKELQQVMARNDHTDREYLIATLCLLSELLAIANCDRPIREVFAAALLGDMRAYRAIFETWGIPYEVVPIAQVSRDSKPS